MSYSQLSLEERCSIARLREAGQSIRQIAAAMDRQPSTIARALKRNGGAQVWYRPACAQAQAGARRWSGARLPREDALRDAILANHNNTPRKCLGFQTPAEAFLNPLHFECESTPGSRPE